MCLVDSDYCGRPFGGVAVICKELDNVFSYDLENTSDRIKPISVCDSSGNTIKIIINVCMPHIQVATQYKFQYVVIWMLACPNLLI